MKLRRGEVKIQKERGNVSKCKYLKGSSHLCLVPSMPPGTLKGKIRIRWTRLRGACLLEHSHPFRVTLPSYDIKDQAKSLLGSQDMFIHIEITCLTLFFPC